jgi:chromosome segregation ATPase
VVTAGVVLGPATISAEELAASFPGFATTADLSTRAQEILRDIKYVEGLRAAAQQQLDNLKPELQREADRIAYIVKKMETIVALLEKKIESAEIRLLLQGKLDVYQDLLDREKAIFDALKAQADRLTQNIKGYDAMIRDLKDMLVQELNRINMPVSTAMQNDLDAMADTDPSEFDLPTEPDGYDNFPDLNLGDPNPDSNSG